MINNNLMLNMKVIRMFIKDFGNALNIGVCEY